MRSFVVMAMFARHCLKRMNKLTKELEVVLGPSTGDLQARVGLHSGPGKFERHDRAG